MLLWPKILLLITIVSVKISPLVTDELLTDNSSNWSAGGEFTLSHIHDLYEEAKMC